MTIYAITPKNNPTFVFQNQCVSLKSEENTYVGFLREIETVLNQHMILNGHLPEAVVWAFDGALIERFNVSHTLEKTLLEKYPGLVIVPVNAVENATTMYKQNNLEINLQEAISFALKIKNLDPVEGFSLRKNGDVLEAEPLSPSHGSK